MNELEHLKTKTTTDLDEIAAEYGMLFDCSLDGKLFYFVKYEVGLCDPAFTVMVDYVTKKATILNLDKNIDLCSLKDCVRLLAQCIS